MATLATDTRPFAPFEWMLALRYLRARRQEGFISVLAGFSFLGILLGVFTLITVMAVMNGFRKELFSKIMGLNGHVIVNKVGSDFDGYDEVAKRLATALRVNLGDSITLVSPRGPTTPFGTAPRIKPYKVTAVFEMGMSEYDRTMIFMPLAEAQRYFSKGDTVDVLEVLVDDPETVT